MRIRVSAIWSYSSLDFFKIKIKMVSLPHRMLILISLFSFLALGPSFVAGQDAVQLPPEPPEVHDALNIVDVGANGEVEGFHRETEEEHVNLRQHMNARAAEGFPDESPPYQNPEDLGIAGLPEMP